MRIRKHAKVSPLVYASVKPGTVLKTKCHLNQSPWDVITFSSDPFATPLQPHLFQGGGDDNFLGNGSFGDSIGAADSLASMKSSRNDKKQHGGAAAMEGFKNVENDHNDAETLKQFGLKYDSQKVFCCEKRCSKEVNDGEALCEHHFSRLNNKYNTTNNSPAEPRQRRRRPKRASTSSIADSYYYYASLGLRWGKTRDQRREEFNRKNASSSNGEASDIVAHLESIRVPASSSQLDNPEFNHVEDVDEDSANKRARKPKARSLKSLM